MDLFSAPALLIEQDAGVRTSFFNTAYAVDVYDERGTLLARVRDRGGPGLKGVVRMVDEPGVTPYDLTVTLPDGREALGIRKGFHWLGGGQVTVTGPDGAPVGSLARKFASAIRLSDPAGRPLGDFTDVAAFHYGELAKRDGRRVRRNTLRLHPDQTGPTRLLAIAAGLANNVVSGRGNKA
ncbi:hypothetical protein ACFPM7_03240 [Actinokineospora guangxiensis]|uniref:Scramblase n=1 Tax=Actinokineospora guangxiensis TaxID=1490288 RepID=A0ABW0EF87_9PSEU